jgi:hypothetical protein
MGLSEIAGAMRKNETGLIIRRAEASNDATNNYVQARPSSSCRLCILAAALAAFFSVCGWSQTQLATVSGTITDPSGAVVPGVSVTIVSQSTGLKRSALTDTDGVYRFAGCQLGTFRFAWRNQDSNRRFAKESSSLRLPL